jgi:ribonuclease VapC
VIIDTSVLVAIFAEEPERDRFVDALLAASERRVSVGSWVEFGTVLTRRFQIRDPASTQRKIAELLGLSLVSVDERQAAAAIQGYATFGRGTKHRARLNCGDSFAYALAKITGEPLLFKGNDFNHTDILLASESVYPR